MLMSVSSSFIFRSLEHRNEELLQTLVSVQRSQAALEESLVDRADRIR